MSMGSFAAHMRQQYDDMTRALDLITRNNKLSAALVAQAQCYIAQISWYDDYLEHGDITSDTTRQAWAESRLEIVTAILNEYQQLNGYEAHQYVEELQEVQRRYAQIP